MISQVPDVSLAELGEANATLRGILDRHINDFNRVIAFIRSTEGCAPPDSIKSNFSEKARDIVPFMIQGVGSSCHTVYVLSDGNELHVRDCFTVARSIVEGIINVCFILAKGDIAAQRATDHAMQKSFRDLQREVTSQNTFVRLEHRGRPDPSAIEGLEKALAQWTNKKGREISTWTPESLVERINVVGEKFGKEVERNLVYAFFGIYRHASEIAHGTLFGSLFFFGATQGIDKDLEQVRFAIASHLFGILDAIVTGNAALITTVGKAYAAEALFGSEIDNLFRELTEIPLIKKHLT